MKHNIRQRIYKTVDGKGYFAPLVRQEECELGSKVFDKNGIEIFEGDLVKEVGTIDEAISVVKFERGVFTIGYSICLDAFSDGELEIVGHAED